MEEDNIHNRISTNELSPIRRKNEHCYCSSQLLLSKDKTHKIIQNTKGEFDEEILGSRRLLKRRQNQHEHEHARREKNCRRLL